VSYFSPNLKLQILQFSIWGAIWYVSSHSSEANCCKLLYFVHLPFTFLHWLPVQRQVEFKILCLVHQCLASSAPMYLTVGIQLVSKHGHRHLHSSFNRTLVVPRVRTSLGDKLCCHGTPSVELSTS